jgi:hypothetical protein
LLRGESFATATEPCDSDEIPVTELLVILDELVPRDGILSFP